MVENWKNIEGYEGMYQVSNLGRVKSLNFKRTGKEKILKPFVRKEYLAVNMYKNGVRKTFYIHRLVAEAFMPNPHNLPEVNHKDEDKSNNRVDNLEWCNKKYNANFGTRTERSAKARLGRGFKWIVQLDKDDNILRFWEGSKIAANTLGIAESSIIACAKGKLKTSGKFRWKYVQ